MSDKGLIEKIQGRGHWHIIIRPEQFIAERIPTLTECEDIVASNQVRYLGWYLPYTTDRQHMHRGLDYIEAELSAFGSEHETWRFYQSGQFALFRAFREDWTKEDSWFPSHQRPAIEPGTKLGILTSLYQLSEVYEFAARLGQAGILGSQFFLSVNLANTRGRHLFYWGSAKYDFPPLIPPSTECKLEELPKQSTFDAVDFVARSRQYSFKHFLWLLERFNVDISGGFPNFKLDQEKLFEGRS